MAKVLFTAKEVAALKEVAELIGELKGARDNYKAINHLVSKMETALLPSNKRPSEFPVTEFLVMARLVLGPRFKEQLKPSGTWYKQMQFRIDSRGINRAMANVALENIRDTWKGDLWVDTVINSLDKMAVCTPQNQNQGKMGWLKKLQADEDKMPELRYPGYDSSDQEAE